jgi:hypothetical protein
MKYSLPTGEVVDIELDDILEIDFKTTKGKQVFQEIMFYKDSVKKFKDFDDAIDNDSLKFLDGIKPDKLDDDIEDNEDSVNSLEDYEMQLFYDSIKEKSGEE